MSASILQEYEAKLDSKHRCVIHGIPAFNRYRVRIFKTGRIEMTPRVLASPSELSKNTLRMVYGSITNLKAGKAGSPVDFKKYKKYLKDED